MSKRLSYVGHDSNYLPVEPNTDSQDELREAIAAIQNRQYDKQITIAEAITQTLKLITARDAEREAAIRKTERRKGIRDGYSYALTEIDIANDYVDAWKRVSAAHKKAVERCHD